MSLIATLSIEVGASIAKSILKLWLKDFDIAVDTASTIVDMLKSKMTDRVAQQRAQRQFEAIGEKVGESLLPIFEADGTLDEGSRTAVALAVAETLNTISGEAMVQLNLDPSRLATYLLDKHPATGYHFNETETLLYQRIISESCAYIVDIASQLPTFNKDTSVEILKREGQILGIANEILQEVSWMRKQLNPQEKDAQEAAHFELEYRRAVLRNLDTLQLFGTDVTVSSRRHRLSVAYVMLSVERKVWELAQPENTQSATSIVHIGSGDETLKALPSQSQRGALPQQANVEDMPTIVYTQSPRKEIPEQIIRALGGLEDALKSQAMIIQTAAESVITADEALARSQRLLIRGLAGSGKTTLLQWIAVTSASQSFKEPLKGWNDTIPFYIRLRSCVQSGLPAPEAFPKFAAASITGLMPKGWAHAKLTTGRALILVDGLDEVPALQREEVRSWLKDLIETYSKAYFIITSRPHAIGEQWIDDKGFELAELQPMTLPDIYTFIDHWHTAVAEEVTDTEEKAELPSLAKHLKEEIEHSRTKRNLATNPLLCAMLCALNRERQQNLPSDRIELYEASCQMLIERRDKERRVLLTDYPAQALTYRQKRALLEDFAYWLMKNGWSEIELYRADERFKRKLTSMHNIVPNISAIDIRLLFLERTGIVREAVASRISFTHRTFQEFLAAQAVLDEGDIGMLIEHAHNDQWWEVIILTSGLATKKVREELLLGLIDRGDREKENRYPIHMLAVACLETSLELEPVVKQDIQQCLSELVPPKNITEAKGLAKAGQLAVPYLVYDPQYSALTAAACVFALAHIGGNAASDALEGYIHDPQIEVIEELLRAQDLFDKRVYAQRILPRILDLLPNKKS
ncbi:MAG TPA: NACHT domain-containing protein [Ktedonobacteraceae bacterium]|nr:NACHT domain-containing protein [Ktedonobacteraceae bacterium]